MPTSDSTRLADPEAKLSLPEFIKEPVPEHVVVKVPRQPRLKSRSKLRSRSLSAPPLAWLLHPSSKASSPISDTKSQKTSRSGTSRDPVLNTEGLDVHYVAENHENLHHILVFLTVTGVNSGASVEAEVMASSADGDRLIIKKGLNVSDPLSLPGRAAPGKAEVKVQSGHYEVKLASPTSTLSSGSDSTPLMDASQLSTASPTSFICASCSLPLVHSSGIDNYRDLPSEHWEELVDAWMCHADQTLHSHVAKHGQGFWPEPGQALVGGSYILFEESSIVKNNFCPAEQSKVRSTVYHSLIFRTIKKTGVGDPTNGCVLHQPPAMPLIYRSPRWFWCIAWSGCGGCLVHQQAKMLSVDTKRSR
jgi:ubiquitin-protein ligase E3 D